MKIFIIAFVVFIASFFPCRLIVRKIYTDAWDFLERRLKDKYEIKSGSIEEDKKNYINGWAHGYAFVVTIIILLLMKGD